MNKTKIEWVKNPDGTQGYTWNPITGCLNGCEYCYARKLANGRLKGLYMRNAHIPDGDSLDCNFDPFYPRFWEDRLDDPFLTDRNICIKRHTRGQRRTPRGIFVCDMGELFGDWLPRKWQEEIHLLTSLNPQHRFYLLTKQPQNLIKFSPFPDNCWVGVTATNEDMLRIAITHLAKIEAKVKYLSFEPLLGWGDFYKTALSGWLTLVDWVIIGAQTKPIVMPQYSWVSEIVSACDKTGISVFLKNNLNSCEISDYPNLLDPNGNIRQEIPNEIRI